MHALVNPSGLKFLSLMEESNRNFKAKSSLKKGRRFNSDIVMDEKSLSCPEASGKAAPRCVMIFVI